MTFFMVELKKTIQYSVRSISMKILHNDPKAIYMGRFDRTKKETKLFHAGAQVRLKFSGTSLFAVINSSVLWGMLSLGVMIDGESKEIPLSEYNNGEEITVVAAAGLDEGVHEVVIYKRHAANQTLSLISFETDGKFLSPDPLPELKLEVYGDSVCAGEVIEAVDHVGQCDPEDHNSRFDNVWDSFVMQTARNLNAQIHNICQGGIAIFNGTGYFHAPDFIGLESTFDKTCYFPEGGEITKWDFGKYCPDIVIIAVGQNDKHDGINDNDDINIADPDYRKKWKDAYKKIVRELDGYYKNSAKFVLTTTVLMHDAEWDNAIDEIKNELNAEGIKAYHNLFSRNGAATPGHPRLPEHNEMAEELTEFIQSIIDNE